MKLRTKYLLFVIILHLLTLVLSFFIFRNYKILFLLSEVLILISALFAWKLYNELLQPLNTIMSGLEAIKERNFNMKFVLTGKYEMDQLITVYNQMMDQLRLERTRQEEQHFFLSKLINTSPTGIVVLSHDGLIQQLNPKAAALLGEGEDVLVGKLPGDLDLVLMQEINKLNTGEAKTVTINGTNTFKLQKSHFIDRGFPRHFVMIEELTNEILAAEKKAYGTVIRMMAHEVNNTIGPVNSIIESALEHENLWHEGEGEPLQHALRVAVERNQKLNHFMRNFADVVRLPEPEKTNIDLHLLISEVVTLLKLNVIQKAITFEYDFANDPVVIRADEHLMSQALINITKNSIEAIDSTGTIRFSTFLNPQKLIITDTGKGIDKPITENIFTPFFSTKKDGQGIGLTLVKEILLKHQFKFSLRTIKPGETRFEINFENSRQ
jgi:nitrogen fixation/metabolism regulation signal transduction histidine kinase